MKISAKARYALRILMDIACHANDEHPRLMKDICETESLSEKFTSRLVIPLREAGMISSTRGKQGGFRLSKSPREITLLDIIETMQGSLAIVNCVQDAKGCERAKRCPSRLIWSDVNDAIRNTLGTITLETVIGRLKGAAI